MENIKNSNKKTRLENAYNGNSKKYYSDLKELVEENIISYLPPVEERSSVLYDAMAYSLNAGGKRLRPVILLAVCQICGGDIRQALPFACAIEYVHTYSLIHDDHPSMDNDDLRRGKPTNHKVFGDGNAILAGDGLLNSAFDIMLESIINAGNSDTAALLTKAAYEISKAAGVRGMIAGQAADLQMSDMNEKLDESDDSAAGENMTNNFSSAEDEQELMYIHRNKTGALIRAAARAGAIIAGADGEILDAVTDYSEKIGLTFQIVDDILDVIGDEGLLGKKTGMDIERGKLTYPSLFGLEKSYEFAEISTKAAISQAEIIEGADGFLSKLALDLKKRLS